MANVEQQESTTEYLRRRLNEVKGRWPLISRESGVPYGTIEKIAQGHTTNPQVKTTDALRGWFGALDAMHESLKKVAAS